jgi:hypothetical protein
MLFQPEALGNGEGETALTVVDGESTRTGEDVYAQAQISPQRENAEAIVEIDKTEV